MLNCNEIEVELSAYRDGALPPPDRANVETHLADCASCKASLAAIEKARASLKALPKIKAPVSLKARVRDQINAAPKMASVSPKPVVKMDQIRNIPWAWACGMAAALAVSLMGYVTFFRPQLNYSSTPQDELAFQLKVPSEERAKSFKNVEPEIRKDEQLHDSSEGLRRLDRQENSKADSPAGTAKAEAQRKQSAPTAEPNKRALSEDRDARAEKAANGTGGKQDLVGAAPIAPARKAGLAGDRTQFGGGAGPGEGGEPRRRQRETEQTEKEAAAKPGTAVLKKAVPTAPLAPPAPQVTPPGAASAAAAAPAKAGEDRIRLQEKDENANNALNRASAKAQDAVAKPVAPTQNLGAAHVERKIVESDKKSASPFKDIAGAEEAKKLNDDKPTAAKGGVADEKRKTDGAPPKPAPKPAMASGGAPDGSANGRGARKDPLLAQKELRDEEEKLGKELREIAPQTIILHTSDVAALREKIKLLADAKNAVIASDANAPTDKAIEKTEKGGALSTNLSITVDASRLDALLTSLKTLQNTAAPKEAADPAAPLAPTPLPSESAKDGKSVNGPKVTVRIEIVLDK